MATLQDYLNQINKYQMKQLVYRELLTILQDYMKSDTTEAEKFIPLTIEANLSGEVDSGKVVPEHFIHEVSIEITKVIDKLQEPINKLLAKELE